MAERPGPQDEALERVRAAIDDQYVVERLLGRGGMSDVYLAVDRRHQRRVAVKVLHPELGTALGDERFLREIQIAARLQHPHILPLYDSGRCDDLLYYVMPFVEGESLGDRLRREHSLPIPDAIRIAREVADGLGHAHELGVIHRDIKPANILLSGGHAVIADFGIATALDAGMGRTRLTGTGQALGTPSYMSPEQAFGDTAVDGRTDIYGLGCVLYEMLAGQLPFTGPTAQAILLRHMTDEAPSIQTVRPVVSDELVGVVRRAMAKLPADRYATVRTFSSALASAAAHGEVDTGRRLGSPRAELDPHTIAILPFKNLSNAPDAEPFAAGLHDDLLTELSRASALTVISRTSVQAYRGTSKTANEIGRELGAGTIVEGGLQKAGHRVRLNIQLIDARVGVQLWADRYDRELSAETIFDLQSELATRIMSELNAKLTPSEGAVEPGRPTHDLEAYRQYSIGRALFVDRSADALRQATEHFERAVARDPGYALAWAGLSLACVNIVDYRHSDSEELLERGEAAARKALDLDPELAEAHSALGGFYTAVKRCREGLGSHRRAAAMRPGFAGAHQWSCWASLLIGDPAAAAEAGGRALQLDPLDPEVKGNLAMAHLGSGRADEALRVARAGLAQHPEFDWVRWPAALALDRLGRHEEALDMTDGLGEAWSRHWPPTARALASVRAGDRNEARRILDRHLAAGAAFHAGILHAALDDPDRSFEAIRSALPLEWDEALYLRYYGDCPLILLCEDPRWGELIADLDRGWGA